MQAQILTRLELNLLFLQQSLPSLFLLGQVLFLFREQLLAQVYLHQRSLFPYWPARFVLQHTLGLRTDETILPPGYNPASHHGRHDTRCQDYIGLRNYLCLLPCDTRMLLSGNLSQPHLPCGKDYRVISGHAHNPDLLIS